MSTPEETLTVTLKSDNTRIIRDRDGNEIILPPMSTVRGDRRVYNPALAEINLASGQHYRMPEEQVREAILTPDQGGGFLQDVRAIGSALQNLYELTLHRETQVRAPDGIIERLARQAARDSGGRTD